MNKTVAQPQKEIGFRKAMDQMNKPGTRLVRMITEASPDGRAHYVVPGGLVSSAVAEKIKARPNVVGGADGLFPGHDQTWRIGTD
jgi:hypothetical protein